MLAPLFHQHSWTLKSHTPAASTQHFTKVQFRDGILQPACARNLVHQCIRNNAVNSVSTCTTHAAYIGNTPPPPPPPPPPRQPSRSPAGLQSALSKTVIDSASCSVWVVQAGQRCSTATDLLFIYALQQRRIYDRGPRTHTIKADVIRV